jgi:hypothetical protein
MISDEIREQLQNIIRGELQKGQVDPCTAVRNILCESFGTGSTVKSEFESKAIIKEKQVCFLKSYAEKEGLCYSKFSNNCRVKRTIRNFRIIAAGLGDR